MTLTNEQLKMAYEMNESGITWEVIAAFFKINTKTLLKERKAYDLRTTE